MNTLDTGMHIGQYEIMRPLGRGGMAIVALAKHRDLGTLVALKLLHIASRGVVERLLQEGRLQASIHHPNVVDVTDILRFNGMPCLVMEYADGPSLNGLMTNFHCTIPQVDYIADQLFSGLAAAHTSPMVHRDLKPQNILLDLTDDTVTAKITDFGLAKARDEESDSLGRFATRSGQMLGTPSYMAPEQFEDAKTADERADLFSLGAMLYELLTGVPPFGEDSYVHIHARAIDGEYAPITDAYPECPERICRAIRAVLWPEREDRIATVEDMREIWFDGTSPPANPWTPVDIEALRRIRDTEHRYTARTPAEFVTTSHPPVTLDSIGGQPPSAPPPVRSYRTLYTVAAVTAALMTLLWSGILLGVLSATGVIAVGPSASHADTPALIDVHP